MKASYMGVTLEGTADEVVSAITQLMKVQQPHYIYPYPYWGNYTYPSATNVRSTYPGATGLTSNNNGTKSYYTPITYTQAE